MNDHAGERAATGRRAGLKDVLFKVGTRVHQAVFRVTKGRVLGRAGGMPVLILITTGRKSGKQRSTMLTAPVHDGEHIVLVASYGGDDRNPDWFLNLRDEPNVSVTVSGVSRRMRARIASSAEKAELWPRIVDAYHGYAGYQDNTRRDIPVVVLEAVSGASPNPDVVSVERVIAAPPAAIFRLVADAAKHPVIDGSGTVRSAQPGAPERLVLGSTFGMSMRAGLSYSMVNCVIEYEDNRRIAWQARPAGPLGKLIGGRIWRYQLEPVEGGTRVTESWDIRHDRQRALLHRGGWPGRARRNMERTLVRIAELLQADP